MLGWPSAVISGFVPGQIHRQAALTDTPRHVAPSQATRHAQTELAGFDNTPKLARADAMMVEDKDCFTCVKGSSKWVMDHVIDYIKAKCEETECPKLKEMCEKAAEHPEVTFGYLVGTLSTSWFCP